MDIEAIALRLASRDKRLSLSARCIAWIASVCALSVANPIFDSLLRDVLVDPLVRRAKGEVSPEIWSEHYAAAVGSRDVPGDEFAAIAISTVFVGMLVVVGYLLFEGLF